MFLHNVIDHKLTRLLKNIEKSRTKVRFEKMRFIKMQFLTRLLKKIEKSCQKMVFGFMHLGKVTLFDATFQFFLKVA